MEHFADALLNRKFDLKAEILAVEKLFNDSGVESSVSLRVTRNFLLWKHRNNYVTFSDFRDGIGISNILQRCRSKGSVSINDFIFYCEYMLSILYIPNVIGVSRIITIQDNIDNALEKLNYTRHCVDGLFHIIEKNILVSEAADIVKDNYDLGESIYSFNYRELKGDLNAKADILCRLYKYYETIGEYAKNQKGECEALAKDISHLSNKLDVRHAPNSRQESVLGTMTKAEIEEWYDELFRMYLSLIVLVDYKQRRKDINELKSKLG